MTEIERLESQYWILEDMLWDYKKIDFIYTFYNNDETLLNNVIYCYNNFYDYKILFDLNKLKTAPRDLLCDIFQEQKRIDSLIDKHKIIN